LWPSTEKNEPPFNQICIHKMSRMAEMSEMAKMSKISEMDGTVSRVSLF